MSILGIMALSGAAGGLSGLLSASEEDKAARRANRAIDKAMSRIDTQRDESRRDFSNTAESFLTNYALVRDPERAEGIRSSYSQERQRQDQRNLSYDDTQLKLEASRPQSGSSILGSTLTGIGLGVASGGAQLLGQSMGQAGSTPVDAGYTPTPQSLDFGKQLDLSGNKPTIGFSNESPFKSNWLEEVKPDQFKAYPL